MADGFVCYWGGVQSGTGRRVVSFPPSTAALKTAQSIKVTTVGREKLQNLCCAVDTGVATITGSHARFVKLVPPAKVFSIFQGLRQALALCLWQQQSQQPGSY